jgi:hypothetical protein
MPAANAAMPAPVRGVVLAILITSNVACGGGPVVTAPCPFTTPSGDRAPAEGAWPVNHRVGQLWVWVPGQAWASTPQPDGSFDLKVGWWRGVPGQLRIEGRRIDGTAPALRARIPDGYGPIGFQSTNLTFPTAGCWEVTGSVGSEQITFIDEIVNASR